MRNTAGIAGAFLLGWILFQAGTLTRFPHVNWDENMEANHSWNLATTGHSVYSLYDDVYPAGFSFSRHSTPNLIRPFFNGAESLFFRWFGLGIVPSRAMSLAAGALTLLLVYFVAAAAAGPAAGTVALVFLSTRLIFLQGTREARPEALLTLAAMACAALFLDWQKHGYRVNAFLAGILTAVIPGIHTNGIALTVAFGVMALAELSKAERRFGVALWFGGFAVGALFFLTLTNWHDFLVGWKMFGGYFAYQPPAGGGISGLLGSVWSERGRFFPQGLIGSEPVAPWVSWVVGVDALLLLAAVIVVLKDGRRDALATLAAVVFIMQFCFAFFVTTKNPNYSLVTYALAAPVVGGAIVRISKRFARAAIAVAVLTGLAAGVYAFQKISDRPSYAKLIADLRAPLRPEDRVVGAQTFWLGLHDIAYRDQGGLLYHRWLLGERRNFTRALSTFRPSVLIVDKHFRGVFLKPRNNEAPPLESMLRVPYERTAVVDGGSFYGPIEIYRLDWSAIKK